MPDLSRFAIFRPAGSPAPGACSTCSTFQKGHGTADGTAEHVADQSLRLSVPYIPRVPCGNDDAAGDFSGAGATAERSVPHVPHGEQTWGTPRGTVEHQSHQSVDGSVPLVPHVPLENDDAGSAWGAEEWQAAFDERAAILEFEAGLPRAEAEALARNELGERPDPLTSDL